jgi:YihY family inner membrane protein
LGFSIMTGEHIRMKDREPRTLKQLVQWLRKAIESPRSELGRWQRRARFAYDLGTYGARRLRRDSATQMAAALSYRTLFSFLPILVVGTMVVRAVGGMGHFRDRIEEYLISYGLADIRLSTEGGEEELGIDAPKSQTLSAWVLQLYDEAERIDLTAITWVGVAVLIYSAISLMVTIENSTNAIFRAPKGRKWSRRFPIYWTLLTLAPVAVIGTIYIDHQISAFVDSLTGFWTVLTILGPLSAFIGTWGVLFAAYRWLPNTHVRTRPAAIGALSAALALMGGKALLGAYLGNAFTLRHLYGSLGLIPLFMFWLYIMWLIVLFGTEVAAALQKFSSGTIVDEDETTGSAHLITEPGTLVAVMQIIAARFGEGRRTSAEDVAEGLRLEEATVRHMLDSLVDAQLLHWLDRGEGTVTPSQPISKIRLDAILDVGFALAGDAPTTTIPVLQKLREAQRALAKETSLDELVAVDDSAPSA